VNGKLTNFLSFVDLEGNTPTWDVAFYDQASFNNSTNSTWNPTNRQLVIVPNSGYVGPLYVYSDITPDTSWQNWDHQVHTFAIGDTRITALATTGFVARAGVTFSNLLASFTNGVPGSATTNFVAAINWGDNSTNNGSMITNLNGWKEVRRAHTYTNAGTYPISIRVRSNRGAETTVVTTAYVQPVITLTRTGTNNVLRWPAWADYLPQTHTNLSTPDWTTLTNLPSLIGYESVLSNATTTPNAFFRLRR
jgi:hypothetical protein